MDTSYDACQCIKSELDLFTVPPVNISMERGDYEVFHPVASISENSPLEFHVGGTSDQYVDLGRTKILLRVKISKLDGSNLDDKQNISPVNLLLHSLFSQVDLKLNEVLVSPSVNTYPYKSYFEVLLSHGV